MDLNSFPTSSFSPPPSPSLSPQSKGHHHFTDELTVEERNLLSIAYKNVIGLRRAFWRIVLHQAIITIYNPLVNAFAIPSKALLNQTLLLYFHFSFSSSYMIFLTIAVIVRLKEKFDEAMRRSNVKAIVLTD